MFLFPWLALNLFRHFLSLSGDMQSLFTNFSPREGTWNERQLSVVGIRPFLLALSKCVYDKEDKGRRVKNHRHGFCLHSWKSETRESEPRLYSHLLPGMSCFPFSILAFHWIIQVAEERGCGSGLCTRVVPGERARSRRVVNWWEIAPQKHGFRGVPLFTLNILAYL